jgi:hypothetical protein
MVASELRSKKLRELHSYVGPKSVRVLSEMLPITGNAAKV